MKIRLVKAIQAILSATSSMEVPCLVALLRASLRALCPFLSRPRHRIYRLKSVIEISPFRYNFATIVCQLLPLLYFFAVSVPSIIGATAKTGALKYRPFSDVSTVCDVSLMVWSILFNSLARFPRIRQSQFDDTCSVELSAGSEHKHQAERGLILCRSK
jgi:hypothetical protein